MKYKLYEVGGKNRDEILGIKSKDVDYSVVIEDLSLSIDQAFYKFRDQLLIEGYEVFLETLECFTIRAKFPKKHKYPGVADFVLARKELYYLENGRKPISELGTLKDDLIRRDFTVNAIAKDEKGSIIDLFNGVHDLHLGILRTPTDTNISFNDDPLRILRAFRFALTKDLSFSDDIYSAIRFFNTNKMKVVSKERIREELNKMFLFDSPLAFNKLRMLESLNHSLFGYIMEQITFTVNVKY
jgi:poly(A) polymerase